MTHHRTVILSSRKTRCQKILEKQEKQWVYSKLNGLAKNGFTVGRWSPVLVCITAMVGQTGTTITPSWDSAGRPRCDHPPQDTADHTAPAPRQQAGHSQQSQRKNEVVHWGLSPKAGWSPSHTQNSSLLTANSILALWVKLKLYLQAFFEAETLSAYLLLFKVD